MRRARRRNGFSLVELLIVVGVSGIVALGVATMFQNMLKEQSFIQQKLDALVAQSLITSSIVNDVGNCSLSIVGKPFDVASPPANFTLNELILGPAATPSAIVKTTASALPGGVFADSIRVANIVPDTNPNDFKGDMQIQFKNTVRSTKAMTFPLVFTVDPATNLITGCKAKATIPDIVTLPLGGSQVYPGGTCNSGWMVSPSLSSQRLDCGTNDLWVAVAIPRIDGTLRYDMTVEFGSPKGGNSGHGWYYFVRGLSQRHYISPASLDPSVPHTFALEFYIGNRTNNYAQNAAAFSVWTAATPATAHLCIKLIDTTMMIECLH